MSWLFDVVCVWLGLKLLGLSATNVAALWTPILRTFTKLSASPYLIDLQNTNSILYKNICAISNVYQVSANHHCRFQFLAYTRPLSNIHRLASSRALPSQLNQANHLGSLSAASGEVALAIESADQLAVVLSVGGGLHGGNDLLDGLAVLDGGQSTVSLARLAAVTVVLRFDTSLELVFLDIEVELDRRVNTQQPADNIKCVSPS